MAARRCSLCGISYPLLPQFEVCPIHAEPTSPIKADPDADWKSALGRLVKQSEAANELARVIPLVRGVTSQEDAGLLWVSSEGLYRAGARFNSAAGGFFLFELEDGWIYETQGWDEPRRRWWVERVIPAEGGPVAK